MKTFNPQHGISTQVNHAGEGQNPFDANVTPIFQTSTFNFPDAATGAAIFKGEKPGFIYTRMGNPNLEQAAAKIAVLEGLDLLRAQPERQPSEIVDGLMFASGMAAITAAILACVQSGDTIIAQEALYSATYNFLHELAPRYGIQTIWLKDPSPEHWQATFQDHPHARLAYVETPSNPTLALVNLEIVAQIAHANQAWMMVDNTFASPYCQRPLTLGADIVLHSTTKYLSGHGLIIGGCVVSTHLEYVRGELYTFLKTLGGSASPFDAWLTNIGLKTYEIRMQRHCENAAQIATFLEKHPAVARVYYPGLNSHPDHTLARQQMLEFGGVLAFVLKGGLPAGIALMDHVLLCTLAPTLGNVDTLIQHPASMSHSNLSAEQRLKMGINDGLVRLSVGIENVEDILADLEQALR